MDKERADEIRDAVKLVVYGPAEADPTREPSSLRAVAREIGMTPSGLVKFLRGSLPYSRTAHRLEQWMDRQGPDGLEKQEAAALALLLSRIAPAQREQAERLVRQLIAQLEAEFPVPIAPRPRRYAVRERPKPHERLETCMECGKDVPVNALGAHMRRHRLA